MINGGEYESKRERRQERAHERSLLPKRSNTQQLAELDRRLGTNVGALRERRRLIERMTSGRAA